MNRLSPYKALAACPIDGFRFEILRCDSADYMPFHSHDKGHFVFVLKGEVDDSRKRQSYSRGPKSLTYLPAGEVHATGCSEGSEILQFVIDPEAFRQYENFGLKMDHAAECSSSASQWLAMRMHSELIRKDDLSPLMLKGMGLELLASMSREIAPSEMHEAPGWLRSAKDYLHAHFAENVSVDQLALAVSIHPAHLMRCFRRVYRCTIGDYIRNLRIDYARVLLLTSNASSSSIALLAGFSDQSHFIRAFKAATGMTPSNFQKVHQKASEVQ